MIDFLKKPLGKIAAGVAILLLLWLAWDAAASSLKSWALRKAEARYEEQMTDLTMKIDAGKKAYNALAEKAGRDRQTLIENAQADRRKAEAVFAVFKSKSAAELREKGAQLAEVLAEKEKDEIALVEARETIADMALDAEERAAAWAQWDKAKDEKHAQIVSDLEMKYSACRDWSAKLEKRLRPRSPLLRYGEKALWFGLGAAIGRGIK